MMAHCPIPMAWHNMLWNDMLWHTRTCKRGEPHAATVELRLRVTYVFLFILLVGLSGLFSHLPSFSRTIYSPPILVPSCPHPLAASRLGSSPSLREGLRGRSVVQAVQEPDARDSHCSQKRSAYVSEPAGESPQEGRRLPEREHSKCKSARSPRRYPRKKD
jgi:hypothetical protein